MRIIFITKNPALFYYHLLPAKTTITWTIIIACKHDNVIRNKKKYR